MKVGIFFGGRSREREVSFAGGRTIFDNIDKSIFTPVPIFVDSLGNFILLDWQNIYKGSITDFYPVSDLCGENEFKIYIESLSNLSDQRLMEHINSVGKLLHPHQFAEIFDFAFLVLHGAYAEDGDIQGVLEWYNIPYSGTSILGSAIGMNKIFQKRFMQSLGFNFIRDYTVVRKDWIFGNQDEIIADIINLVGRDLVVKSACQGSSIGISAVKNVTQSSLKDAIDKSFFIQRLTRRTWRSMSEQLKKLWLMDLVDVTSGLGFPIEVKDKVFYRPLELLKFVEKFFYEHEHVHDLALCSVYGESSVLVETYIEGREFSCIVLEGDDGSPVALPPTEMVKSSTMLSYRDKYLPGAVNKGTPIDLSESEMITLTSLCCKVFSFLEFQVYARIDGIITNEFEVFINDPNTTVGMTPSSFLFHQAAEIGLSPSQLVTFIIRRSLASRLSESKKFRNCLDLLNYVDEKLDVKFNSKRTAHYDV